MNDDRYLTNNLGSPAMEHIKTLKVFDELVGAGVPEQQSRAHVYALNNSLRHLDEKLMLRIDTLEKDLKKLIEGK